MKTRNWLALGALTLTTACYEFEGDQGNLGFDSNLVAPAPPWFHWNPNTFPVARGTTVTVEAAELLSDNSEDPAVSASLTGGELVSQAQGSVTFIPGRRKTVVSWTGETTDSFTVTTAKVRRGGWSDGMHDKPLKRVGVVTDELQLIPMFVDRKARTLALDWDDLVLSGDCLDGQGRPDLPPVGQTCTAVATLFGVDASIDVVHVTADQVVSLELVERAFEHEGDRLVLLQAVGQTADGLPVLGLPVTWDGPVEPTQDDAGIHVIQGEGPVTVTLGELSATR
jgi:hypothetical protein